VGLALAQSTEHVLLAVLLAGLTPPPLRLWVADNSLEDFLFV